MGSSSRGVEAVGRLAAREGANSAPLAAGREQDLPGGPVGLLHALSHAEPRQPTLDDPRLAL